MSYQVIARKWRPKNFQELIGQEHVSQTLLNALKTNRFPHALLFTGTRGVGKTSVARILAKILLCPNSQMNKPCDNCPTCEAITAGNCVDVIEIDGASNNGVDAIRELRETVGYLPAGGKHKVYIIDEVHMLTTSAFNALLKTLEEPPPHVIFVMATTEPQKMPITILSRCQRFDLRRIGTRLIREHIEKICVAEKISFESDAIWAIARQADGSMRDGLSLLDQVINFTNSKLTQSNVIEVLGLTDRTLLLETLTALCNRNLQKVLVVIEKVFSAGYDPSNFVKDLLEEIRHLLLVKLDTQGKSQLLDLADSEIEALKSLSSALSQEDLHLLFDMALKGAQDVVRAQVPRVVLEMVLLRMAQAPRIQNISSFIGQNPVVASAPTAPAIPAKKPNFEWPQFVERAKTENPLLGAQLVNVAMVRLSDQALVLGVTETQKFLFEQLNTPKTLEKIAILAKSIWNKSIQVEIVISNDIPPSPQALSRKKTDDDKQQVKSQVENHPLIKKTQTVFKTEIQSISKETK